MTDEARYQASEQGLLTELGDGTGVLLDMQSNFYFSMNETAIFIWKLLVGHGHEAMTRVELAQALAREFEVEATQARDDVNALLEQLTREHLVKTL